MQTSAANPNFGFMTVVHEAGGYIGGYLVTNSWSRPLEFRLTTAVQPNRIQQILYGRALEPYIFADLIGKALVERTSTPVQMILTDQFPLLDLRPRVDMPMVCLAKSTQSIRTPSAQKVSEAVVPGGNTVFCHAEFRADEQAVSQFLVRLGEAIDLDEPFIRVREAIKEARKMGATARVSA